MTKILSVPRVITFRELALVSIQIIILFRQLKHQCKSLLFSAQIFSKFCFFTRHREQRVRHASAILLMESSDTPFPCLSTFRRSPCTGERKIIYVGFIFSITGSIVSTITSSRLSLKVNSSSVASTRVIMWEPQSS